MHEMKQNFQTIWISHMLSPETPCYGGVENLYISQEKKISEGNHCNSSKLILSNHVGTHVDVPYHFIETGKKIGDYKPSEWVFNKCGIIEINANPDDIITLSNIQLLLENLNDVDFLLIKTGFEQYRPYSIYWEHSPGYSDEIAYYLKNKFPSISAIGFDSISLTGYQHRDLGRKAHQAFLSIGIRIFEDMHLMPLTRHTFISKIIALPLRFDCADGAPCSIIADIEVYNS